MTFLVWLHVHNMTILPLFWILLEESWIILEFWLFSWFMRVIHSFSRFLCCDMIRQRTVSGISQYYAMKDWNTQVNIITWQLMRSFFREEKSWKKAVPPLVVCVCVFGGGGGWKVKNTDLYAAGFAHSFKECIRERWIYKIQTQRADYARCDQILLWKYKR